MQRSALVGSLRLRVRVRMPPIAARLLRAPSIPCADSRPLFTKPDGDEAVWWRDLNDKDIKANEDRLLAMLTPPVLLVVIWTNTIAAVLAMISWFYVSRAGAWALPPAAFVFMALNGAIVARQRRRAWDAQTAYRVFEDDVGRRELLRTGESLLHLQNTLFDIQMGVGRLASALEVVSFAVSWADVFVSLYFYCVAAALACVLAAFFYVVPMGVLFCISGWLVIGSGYFCYARTRSLMDLHQEQMERKRETGFGLKEETKDQDRTKSRFAFWQRLPNDLEMSHRYIAARVQLQEMRML